MENIIKQFKTSWNNLNPILRWVLPTVILSTIIFGLFYMIKPEKSEILYNGLSDEDYIEIQQRLSEKGIEFELSESENTILVDGNAALIKRDLALLGLPKNTVVTGLAKFEEMSIGSTKFDKEVQYQSRLQEDLEVAIEQAFEDIEKASVKLPRIKEKSIFEDDLEDLQISVAIKVKNGREMTPENVEAIQIFVASSVQEVSSNDVEIVDSEMNVLSIDKSNDRNYGLSNEIKIIDETKVRIEEDLSRVLKGVYGEVEVVVNVDINFDEIVQNIETYDPEGTLLSTESSTERERSVTGELDEIVGIEENGEVPGYEIENLDEEDITYLKDKEHLIENFSIGKVVEKIIRHPELRNTNVAVWIDSGFGNNELTEVEITDLEEMIAISSGLTGEVQRVENDKSVYDNGSVKVTQRNFYRPGIEDVEEEEQVIKSINWILVTVGISTLLILLSIIIILIIKRKKKTEEEVDSFEDILEDTGINNDSESLLDITIDEENEKSDFEETKEEEDVFQFEWTEQQNDLRKLTNEVTSKFPKETADVIKKLLEK